MRGIKHRGLLFFLFIIFAAMLLCTAQAEDGKITGTAWQDKNGDGLLNGENFLDDVTVTLEQRLPDGTVKPLSEVKTRADGAYAFSVQEGEYRLSFQLPNNNRFTFHGLDSAALPSAASRSTTPFFTVSAGENVIQNVGSIKSNSYISLVAFEDSNANGGRMSTEPLLRNVKATLLYDYDGETYEIASAVSNANGECSIRELTPGTYYLKVDLPENYVSGPMGNKINTFHNCLLASEANIAYTMPFEVPFKGGIGMGLGAVKTGSLTGRFWYDENANEIWDENESSLPGTKLLLSSATLSLTRESAPDADGNYSFTGLQPGDYQLIFQLPEGYLFTDGKNSLLNDTSSEAQLNVSIITEVTTKLGDVGAARASALSVQLVEDKNKNTSADENDEMISGVNLQLSQNGKKLGTFETDESGCIRFPVIRQGTASLTAELPEGYVFLMPECEKISKEYAVQIDIAEDEQSLTLYAIRASSISGMLFDDPENIGIYDEKSSPLSGFTVQAVNSDGEVMAQAQTEAQGKYLLNNLIPGSYTVRFLLDENYIAAPYAADGAGIVNHIASQTPDYGETGEIQLGYNEDMISVDGAVFKAGIIEGYVLSNEKHDNLATNEGGVSGITVTLLDDTMAPFSEYSYGVTDEKGYFVIKGVLPGQYALSYSLPEDCAFTYPMIEENEFETQLFSVEGGAEIRLTSLGAVKTASMSGTVSSFTNDMPIQGVSISLLSETFQTSFESQTMEDGTFVLDHLRPDSYIMTITIPDGMFFAQTEKSMLPGYAQNTLKVRTALKRGQKFEEANIVIDNPSYVSGVIYFDENMSCQYDDSEKYAEGRTVDFYLNGSKSFSAITDENGFFFVDNLIPGQYQISVPLKENEIFLPGTEMAEGLKDIDIGTETIIKSIPILAYSSVSGQIWNLDGSENDIQGISVSLYDENESLLSSAVSDANGAYSFGKLLPGTYTLKAELPKNYLFARNQDATVRASFIQSDASGEPASFPIQVDMGMYLKGADIGMGAIGSIGDHAWLDENENGMQDIGESDMPGIVIEMYQYGDLIATAVTDGFGRYSLKNLYPGEYEMRVTMPEELKTTKRQTQFPLVASVLPESNDTTVTATVIVPSGEENLHVDLGFVLRKKGVYPSEMSQIPRKDWTPYSER